MSVNIEMPVSYTPLVGATPKSFAALVVLFAAIAGIATGIGLLVHYSSSPVDSNSLLSISSSSSSSSSTGAAPIPNGCLTNPCQNSGTCNATLVSPYYNCTCTAGFNATNCTGIVNYCDSNPCSIGINPGSINCTSNPGPVSNYSCGCASGYNNIGLNTPCYLPFISTWNTSMVGVSTSSQLQLPLVSSGTYNALVSWGDGSTSAITAYTQNNHTYTSPGVYNVSITGIFKGFSFNNAGDKLKITLIRQFGSLSFANTGGYFYGCSNLQIIAPDNLNLAGVTNMANSFQNCAALTTIPSANTWDTSKVTNMANLFNGAIVFNQAIGNWNTSSVTSMTFLFAECAAFNQSIVNWDTSRCTNMADMFLDAVSFNQPIGTWNTAAVTTTKQMFKGATIFNQPIGSWNMAQNKIMQYMFFSSNFNQAIGTWNTSSVTDMSFMFYSASAFNQAIGSWNTGAVTTMDTMFYSSTSFNQPLNSWNTGLVTKMSAMFKACNVFNQPLSNWNTSSVTTMNSMFQSSTAFNQNISSWDVRKVTDMTTMFSGVTLSTANYNALLIGWQQEDSFTPGLTHIVPFDGGNSIYSCYPSAAFFARGNLTTVDGWTPFTDGGCA